MTAALQSLLDHVGQQRDAARAALLQAEDRARRVQQQCQQLQDYRREYEVRHAVQMKDNTGIELLRVHHGFMQRLDHALRQQHAQQQAAQAQTDALRRALLDLERRVAAVTKLTERRATQARADAAQREQRTSDDRRSAPGWRLGSEPMPLGR